MNNTTSFGSSGPKKRKSNVESGEHLLSRHDLHERGINYSDSHLRRMCHDGRFPKPIKLTPRKLAWRLKEIDAWIAEKLAASAE